MAALWTVNVIGSFLLGFAAGYLRHQSAPMRLFASTGLLGSFTTFSAFSAEWFGLIQNSFTQGLAVAVGMTALSVMTAAAGLKIGRREGAE